MQSVRPDPLAIEIIELAAARRLRIGVAESLTGGLLADAFVAVPGASRVFMGGVIAYATPLKHRLLGVSAEQLLRTGPVDPDVACAMAEGVRELCATDLVACTGIEEDAGDPPPLEIGIATTGVAGPDPDPQTGQPAGTVWIAIATPWGTARERVNVDRVDREAIRLAAVQAALRLVHRELIHHERTMHET